jgi:hypothetical protein
LRQIRGGIFQALTDSWQTFMRSPEFLGTMKQGMEQAVTFRKKSHVLMGKIRNEMQAPSCEDIDTIMLTVRHMEKRLLDRIDQLSAQISGAKRPGTAKTNPRPRPPRAATRSKGRRTNNRRATPA